MSTIRPLTGATFSGKLNKSDVNYRYSENCKNCDYYLNGACRIVEGSIAPEFVCDKWVVNSQPKDKGVFADFYIDEYKKAKGK